MQGNNFTYNYPDDFDADAPPLGAGEYAFTWTRLRWLPVALRRDVVTITRELLDANVFARLEAQTQEFPEGALPGQLPIT